MYPLRKPLVYASSPIRRALSGLRGEATMLDEPFAKICIIAFIASLTVACSGRNLPGTTPATTAPAASQTPLAATAVAAASPSAPATNRAAAPGSLATTAAAFPGGRDEPLIPLPGIVFENEQGTWLVEAGRGERLLTPHHDVSLSRDGSQGLRVAGGDVWLLNFEDDGETNLTAQSERVFLSADWWPARPDTLVLTSRRADQSGPGAYLTLMDANAGNIGVINEVAPPGVGLPAAAPDGETIAFDAGLQPMLYRPGLAPAPFDVSSFELPVGVEVLHAGSPAWSPNGRRLAWMMIVRGGGYGGDAGSGIAVLGVFDLQRRRATLIHPFQPIEREGWLLPAVWSPDGQWLAYHVETGDPQERGLWVTRPDGSQRARLRPLYYPPVWSPPGDEHWASGNLLIIGLPTWTLEGDNWLVVSGGWKETALVLPGAIVDWLSPSPPPVTTSIPAGALPDATRLSRPPQGLVAALGSREGGWRLALAGKEGALRTLVDPVAPATYLPDFDVSPDGRQVLYAWDGDIWRLDIASGARENVTQTPARRELLPRWLPGHGAPAGFVCGSLLADAEEGPSAGYLTHVTLDGDYVILVDAGQLAAAPAPAPDGQTIAYSRASERHSRPFLYRLGRGEAALDVAPLGLDWVEKSWEASWSPDGQRLAWGFTGELDGQHVAALALLDLAAGTHELIHVFEPAPSGSIPAPRWAPDGKWLAFMALDLNRQSGGLWRYEVQSGVVAQLSRTFIRSALVRHPAISPDGAWIAAPLNDGSGVGLVDSRSGQTFTWTEQGEVAAVGWAERPR